jgi:hypothetical protein
MKLEVGMYCRYNNFQNKIKIAKIKGIQKADEVFRYDYISFDNDDGELETNIIKASYNIIDILEVGDIIRYRIDKVSLETKGYLTGVIDITDEEMIESIKEDKNYHVLQILTKEQFEEMSYKIKESR